MLTPLLIAASSAATQPPITADSFVEAFAKGTVSFDARARYESVDDNLAAETADALTLRTRLGFKTAPWNGWSAYLEGEDVRALISDYNSTANGKTRFATIADPEGSEINQAYVSFTMSPMGQVLLGRQRIALDNHRFFGNVGFRQNEQTFDAASVQYAPSPTSSLRYLWLDEVHRVFGNSNPNAQLRQQDLNAHLFNGSFKVGTAAFLGYAYFVENQDLPLTSARTLGLRFQDSRSFTNWRLFYSLEYATQDDYQAGSATIDADYRALELGIATPDGKHQVRAFSEILGGDGRYAFQTPFATLHAFNGWADKFLQTPNSGLRDLMFEYSGYLGVGTLQLRHHSFRSDASNIDFGTEVDAAYTWSFHPKFLVQIKAARYNADEFSRDTTKFWFALESKY